MIEIEEEINKYGRTLIILISLWIIGGVCAVVILTIAIVQLMRLTGVAP